jgi:hypothetical protein
MIPATVRIARTSGAMPMAEIVKWAERALAQA